jgi:hypothetical protein
MPCIGECGRGADHPALAGALDEECIGRSWSVDEAGIQQRQVADARRRVIHEARGREPLRVAIPDELHERLTERPRPYRRAPGSPRSFCEYDDPRDHRRRGIRQAAWRSADRVDALWHQRRLSLAIAAQAVWRTAARM